jgi:uncharacterized membrane protein
MKNETLVWVVIALAALFFVLSGFGYGGYGGMMGMMYGNFGSGMMLFSWLYGVLILVALVLFIVWLVKQIQKK